ncbi:MAG TPA: hypothetical protein ACFYD3_03600, partial [Candidatus Hypogeohydataceae bacterium YC41]
HLRQVPLRSPPDKEEAVPLRKWLALEALTKVNQVECRKAANQASQRQVASSPARLAQAK